ncbi:MAG: UDP-glucose/GDP-mannose dehydrogenase family protein [Chloroflexota bacterium]|nr:MAG: UDP-glucose/GDP-mannose dehydrogenase family protein [Chloroflexota bacterium]
MSKICVIGTGYVGLVTGTCFSELGHSVVCVDIDEEKIEDLNRGIVPIYEPGLEEMVISNRARGRLHFTTGYEEGISDADFVFITVGTPPNQDGSADLRQMEGVASRIAQVLRKYTIVVNKSTVPVGTAEWLTHYIQERRGQPVELAVVSNPEFLREGVAVSDFFSPSRVVVGSSNGNAALAVAKLHAPLGCPIVVTDCRTSEMIKYASNAFLATKISFINEIAHICEKVGADVCQVAEGMGRDARIGRSFLDAGLGYGGSCFPKDVQALAQLAEGNGFHPQLLCTVMTINHDQCKLVIKKLQSSLGDLSGRSIGVLGLAFKPDTDDVREAPALTVIRMLIQLGARVRTYDPHAMANARKVLPSEVEYCEDPYQVSAGSDALVVATEWEQFRRLDLERMRSQMARPVVIDGRNMFDPAAMERLGFVYHGVGRCAQNRTSEAWRESSGVLVAYGEENNAWRGAQPDAL